MGRKKRKTEVAPPPEVAPDAAVIASEAATEPTGADVPLSIPVARASDPRAKATTASASQDTEQKAPASSSYAMHSHSGEIVQEDVYVSDGSEDEQDDVDIVLQGSRLGIMRRGLLPTSLVQPNRQWVRHAESSHEATDEVDALAQAAQEEERKRQQEAELAQLDPAQRAARLAQEKLRLEELAKEEARRQEAEQNAGREPTLFSKRTAFDIRFDQIEDKPWMRGTGDLSDFFNYGLNEEDWLEYAQQQLLIRQELQDAHREKRQPDPTLVPVQPKTPATQSARVTVANGTDATQEEGDTENTEEPTQPMGPALPTSQETKEAAASSSSHPPTDLEPPDRTVHVPVGVGGAWGAGAPPGSVLARLIEEQERGGTSISAPPPPSSEYIAQESGQPRTDESYGRAPPPPQDDYYAGGTGGRGWQQQQQPPQSQYPGYRGRGGRGFRGGGRFAGRGPPPPPPPQWDNGGRGSDDYYNRKRPYDGGDPRWRR